MIPKQLDDYRKYGPVFRTGDYYRLASFAENHEYDVIMAVTKDKRLAVLDYVQVLSRYKEKSILIQLDGLDEQAYYRSSETGEIYSGAALMYGGILLPKLNGDFLSRLIVLEMM